MAALSCVRYLALLLGCRADWIAWKGNESQGSPSKGLWQPIPRADRFKAFAWEEGAVNAYRYFFPGASHYTLGNESALLQLEFWQPFTEDQADSAVCAQIRAALLNLYEQNLSHVHVTVRNVGWGGVATRPLCQEAGECPNVILLGSSQLPQKVVADRVQSLNGFMENYLRNKLERLQDDFPGIAYYQYFHRGKWVGIPFMSDVRLIAFNRSTLNALDLELPPPWGLKKEWTWEDLRRDACTVKQRCGVAGLRANSDFDEEFKFFTLQVQSAGGSLYKVTKQEPEQLRCTLNNSLGVQALENFWKPMILEECLESHVSGSYWKNVPGDLEEVLGPINPLDPPSMTEFSNYDYNKKLAGFQGFVLTSGFDERLTVGKCEKKEKWWIRSNWLHCEEVRVLSANLSECKEEMFRREVNTLSLREGRCRLLQCPTDSAVRELLDGSSGSVYSQFCSEILYADMPENHTFLGGSGLVIPKEAGRSHDYCSGDLADVDPVCLRQAHGWQMILELTDTKNPYMEQANLLKQQSVVAPRRSLSEQKASNKLWLPVVNAINRGIPSQYPNVPIPESAEIENIKPVRLAMLRNIYGNVSAQDALDTACAILDELVRPCNTKNWQNDSRCLNPIDGLAGCQVGEKFHEKRFGSFSCSFCGTGSFRGQRSVDQVCAACPSGRFSADEGSSQCETCPFGMVAPMAGQTECYNCSAGQEPVGTSSCNNCSPGTYQEGSRCVPCPNGFTSPSMSPNAQNCYAKASLIWLNLVLVLDFICLVLLTPLFGRAVAVNDIFLDEGKLVLKTWGSHRVSRRSPLPIKIRLTDTCHYLLEDKHFRVKWRYPDELWLLNGEGQHISMDINTSRGRMHMLPQCTLWGRSLCGVHLTLVMLILLAIFVFCITLAILNGQGEEKHLPWALCACLLGGMMAALIHHYLHAAHLRSAPLLRRREEFSQRLRKVNPSPVATERGPDRGITAEKISELFEYFRDFIKERDMHYVTNNLLIPFTEPFCLSYAEVAGASRATWFVSHCWSNSFEDFFQSLRKMAEGKTQNQWTWHWVSFWICSFSNNQFKVKEELGDGDPLKSSFYMALQSPECQGTAMVLDSDCVPLTRSWCLFELLQTRYAPKAREGHEGLLLCTPTGVLQWGHAHVDTVVRLAEKVGEIRLEDAQASRVEDKVMIDACVIQTVKGGFAEVNKFAKESLKTVLDEANGSFQLRVEELMHRLDHGSPQRLLGRSWSLMPSLMTGSMGGSMGGSKSFKEHL